MSDLAAPDVDRSELERPTPLRRYDITDDPEAIIAGIDADGGVIVENFISPDLRARLAAELDGPASAHVTGSDGGSVKQAFSGAQTKRFTGLATRAPSFAEVIDHDLLHRWAEHGFANDYWINTGQAIIIGPGEPGQYLHRDAGNWPIMVAQGKDGPEAVLSIMLALTDFTEENGATRVVPGSHRWDDYRVEADPARTVPAEMPAGSALMYTGKTIHGGGANTSTDQWRFGIHLGFTLGQLTPEEAHPVTTAWEVAQHFPERVQHMLGYHSHRTFRSDWPILWTSDYRDLRDSLEPAPSGDYRSAGARLLGGR
ncbi:MAG: phytanoyl-CoA dioxygenase family protein [Actinomycetota bacterium]